VALDCVRLIRRALTEFDPGCPARDANTGLAFARETPLQGPFAAVGAASLLVYSPTKLDECRFPTVMTYTVHYRQR